MADVFVEIGTAQLTKSGYAACGDNVVLEHDPKENRYLVALSDGLGSGVKANVLSNMTTAMAIRFMKAGIPLGEAVEIMMDALPVCSVRGISYATFALLDYTLGQKASMVEMGGPAHIHLRGVEEVQDEGKGEMTAERWPDRVVRKSLLGVCVGDRIIFCSDGVTEAGIGEGLPGGWKRSGVLAFAQEQLAHTPDLSAQDLSRRIVRESVNITKGIVRDDTSCVVVYVREPRVMRLISGPPVDRASDREYAHRASLGEEHVVVCGGTTVHILERELGAKVENCGDIRAAGDLPPPGRLPGVALTTEGVLTLSRTLKALRAQDAADDPALPLAVREILSRFAAHDRIELVIGCKVNEATNRPELADELELRRSVVRDLAEVLARDGRKQVRIDYF